MIMASCDSKWPEKHRCEKIFLRVYSNFIILHMTDVKKSEILPNMKKCKISPHYRCEEKRNLKRGCDFHCFVTEFVLLQFTHMEKSWAKNCVCGKKCQIMRFCLTCFSSKDLEVSLKGGIWSMVTRVQSKPPSTIVCGWSVLQFWK